jgi:hypothetical protein
MNLATALHRGQQAHAIREPIEFPKWVKVDGRDVLALTAEHELELLTKPSDAEPEVENLLSAPERRDQTTPRLARSKGA